MPRKSYPTDISDEEWSFAVPYLTLMNASASQRRYSLREVFNALRWLVRACHPSSNRAYGFPVHGFPMFFTPRDALIAKVLSWAP